MLRRYELTDEEWNQIVSLLPPDENVKFFCNIFSKKFLTLFTCYSLFIMT